MGQSVDIGSRVGPFEIIGLLGSGGAGSVFRARNVESGEEIALKTLMPGTVVNEEIHKRFVREISVAQKLRHENIVTYVDCGLHEEILYYTMELVPWGSLGEVLSRKRTLPWRDAVECGIEICQGLTHLHEANIVHRDLKPANIFLSDNGHLKLGDFGLARDLTSTRLTIDGHTVGTAKYLSPEQARAGEIDGRTDLYALGCILFEMLAGRPPFISDDPYSPADYVLLMQQHVEDEPPKASDFNADCPPSLSSLIDSLLAKKPADRPQSARVVAESLQAILNNPDAIPEPLERGQADAESSGTEAEGAPPEHLTARLHQDVSVERKASPKVLVAAVGAVLVVVAIAILASQ